MNRRASDHEEADYRRQRNGDSVGWKVAQMVLPAVLSGFVAGMAAYVAVTQRITTVEVKIEERSTSLRQEIAAERVQRERDVETLAARAAAIEALRLGRVGR